jgi:hypothetical protein
MHLHIYILLYLLILILIKAFCLLLLLSWRSIQSWMVGDPSALAPLAPCHLLSVLSQ